MKGKNKNGNGWMKFGLFHYQMELICCGCCSVFNHIYNWYVLYQFFFLFLSIIVVVITLCVCVCSVVGIFRNRWFFWFFLVTNSILDTLKLIMESISMMIMILSPCVCGFNFRSIELLFDFRYIFWSFYFSFYYYCCCYYFIMQWNLVCRNEWLQYLIITVFLIGLLIGFLLHYFLCHK